ADLKRNLEAAMRRSARSLSAEMEFRLEASFLDERHLRDALALAYGPRIAGLVLKMGDAMKAAAAPPGLSSTSPDHDALNDPWHFRQVILAAVRVLDRAKPAGEIVPPPPLPIFDLADVLDDLNETARASLKQQTERHLEERENIGIRSA